MPEGWKQAARRISAHASQTLPWLTKQRLAVFTATMLVVAVALNGLNPSRPADTPANPEFAKDIIPLVLPAREPEITVETDTPASPKRAGGEADDEWVSVEVRSGQTLGGIFREQGLNATVLHQIVELDDSTKRLRKIRPGQVFRFRKDASGELLQMDWAFDDLQRLAIYNEGSSFRAEIQQREFITHVEETDGAISSSLFVAARTAGLSAQLTMELANIFAWDIDFVFDIREGDRFFVIYEKLYRDGEFLRDGRILAASFVNQGQRYRAIRYESETGAVGYFAPDGRPMRKEFLRAPLNFSYISSGFNPARMHPVLKRVRPHRGIDYYAPPGTPVYAAGDGTVIRSAYSKANGHHVFIRHDNSIETRYLHFSNRAVQNGQRVLQGQTIGYVGSTGLATGPHLHYEFLVNGVHRNPRTVPLPQVGPLEGERLALFKNNAASMLNRLTRLEAASLYASGP